MSKPYIRIHLRILHQPRIDLAGIIEATRDIYSAIGIEVEVASIQRLDIPDLLDVYIADCAMGDPTAAQRRLFENRDSCGPRDIFIYFIRSTVPSSTGCASHPSDKAGLIITEIANRWTLAHEIGHVLGLAHVVDQGRLMSSSRTDCETSALPAATSIEQFIIGGSRFIHTEGSANGSVGEVAHSRGVRP